jgi:hypothetical protein
MILYITKETWPAMSGADPWHGSNTPGPDRSPTDADGSMPSDPTWSPSESCPRVKAMPKAGHARTRKQCYIIHNIIHNIK